MDKTQEALRLALEALKELRMLGMNMQWHDSWLAKSETAITAIREALAEQPAQQHIEHCLWARNGNQPCPHVQPASKPWVGLTPEERNSLWRDVIGWGDPSHDEEDLMKAIEAKLKEKNHGS